MERGRGTARNEKLFFSLPAHSLLANSGWSCARIALSQALAFLQPPPAHTRARRWGVLSDPAVISTTVALLRYAGKQKTGVLMGANQNKKIPRPISLPRADALTKQTDTKILACMDARVQNSPLFTALARPHQRLPPTTRYKIRALAGPLVAMIRRVTLFTFWFTCIECTVCIGKPVYCNSPSTLSRPSHLCHRVPILAWIHHASYILYCTQ